MADIHTAGGIAGHMRAWADSRNLEEGGASRQDYEDFVRSALTWGGDSGYWLEALREIFDDMRGWYLPEGTWDVMLGAAEGDSILRIKIAGLGAVAGDPACIAAARGLGEVAAKSTPEEDREVMIGMMFNARNFLPKDESEAEEVRKHSKEVRKIAGGLAPKWSGTTKELMDTAEEVKNLGHTPGL